MTDQTPASHLLTGQADSASLGGGQTYTALSLGTPAGPTQPSAAGLLIQPIGPSVRIVHAAALSGGVSSPSPILAPTVTGPHLSSIAPHLVINATYDASVTGSAVRLQYESATQAAINFYENAISSPLTININFGWGEAGGSPISAGAIGQSSSSYFSYSYSQFRTALVATDTTSAVQTAAVGTLPTTDPTGGGTTTFQINTAEGQALGLNGVQTNDGSVGLDAASTFSWTQTSVAANAYDAVGTLEHEISEVLGRTANGGAGGKYTPLDMFRYTAADGLATDTPGSAAGVLDQPFVAGYNASAYSYFSYNGTTVTNPFDTPTNVAGGADVADWAPSVASDSYGYGVAGQAALVTTVDLQELNVLGYTLAAACYAAGTRIATARGEVAVEALAVGDVVVLAEGGTAPVRWLGHRRLDLRHHPRPRDVWPVRVRRDAFGEGRPGRDLLLSPDHAVFVDGVLIPVRYLLNGATILQEEVAAVTYWHVELDHHAVILAEGLPAESYLDTGNRAAFANGGGAVQLHADFARTIWAREACAPLVVSGVELEAARSFLRWRAGALGHAITDDADPRLVAGGMTLRPVRQGGTLRFRLPAGLDTVRLVSRSFVPAQMGDADADHRRLGIAVAGLTCDGAILALTDPCLGAGWHAAEPGDATSEALRWTDGTAEIAVGGGRLLEVKLAMRAAYWREAPHRRRA